MKFLQFLKSRTGAISGVRAGLMALTVAGVGLSVASYFQGPTTPDSPEVRRLAEIMRQGRELPVQYASIASSFALGNLQFADAEQKAKAEAQIFDGGEGAVQALESFNIQGRTFTGGEGGLGMGNDVQLIEGAPAGAGGSVSGDINGVNKAAEGSQPAKDSATAAAAGAGGAKSNTLQRSSITHPTGGSRFASTPYGAPTAASQLQQGDKGDTSSLSGSMPIGSMLVKATGDLKGAHESGYKPSKDDVKFKKVKSSSVNEEGEETKRIALLSARAAREVKGQVNRGGQVFLTNRGLQFTLEAQDLQTKSNLPGEDYEGNLAKAEKRVGDITDNVTDNEQEKQSARSTLINMLVGLVITSFVGFLAICALKEATTFGKGAALAVTIAILALIALFALKAHVYGNRYGDRSTANGMMFTALILAGIIGVAWIPGVSKAVSKLITKVMGWFGAGGETALTSAASGLKTATLVSGGGVAMTQITEWFGKLFKGSKK